MSGRLTTHVLDTARGLPAAGVAIAVHRDGVLIAQAVTNSNGRTDAPLLAGEAFTAGVYEITFAVGAYFAEQGGFLDEVPVRFTVSDAPAHLHVPLLVSPHAYTTYRGS